jgi:hypothetical protein
VKGDLRIPDGPNLARWDWGWLRGCFGETGISPSDLDFIVERRGCFLAFEIKRPDEPLPDGQLLLLCRLAEIPLVSVFLIRGKRNTPETIQRITLDGLSDTRPTSQEDLRELVRGWFRRADSR